MPRKAETLTAKGIESLIREARETSAAPRDVADGGCPGLTLRLTPTAAVWSIRFRHADKPLRIRLGDAREWTLAQARSVAGAVRDHVEAGQGVPAEEWITLKRAAFEAWTTSEHFRAAHRNAGGNKKMTLAHPEFEGFEVIQTLENPASKRHAAE